MHPSLNGHWRNINSLLDKRWMALHCSVSCLVSCLCFSPQCCTVRHHSFPPWFTLHPLYNVPVQSKEMLLEACAGNMKLCNKSKNKCGSPIKTCSFCGRRTGKNWNCIAIVFFKSMFQNTIPLFFMCAYTLYVAICLPNRVINFDSMYV